MSNAAANGEDEVVDVSEEETPPTTPSAHDFRERIVDSTLAVHGKRLTAIEERIGAIENLLLEQAFTFQAMDGKLDELLSRK
jgi:hypothetical protein